MKSIRNSEGGSPNDVNKTSLALAGGLELPTTESLPDFIRVDKHLVELGFFTVTSRGKNSKLKKTPVKTIHLSQPSADGHQVQTSVRIVTGGSYGLPSTADLDKWFALMKIVNNIQNRDGCIVNPVGFTSWELHAILGNKSDSNKNFQAIAEWLDRMYATTIELIGSVGARGERSSEKRSLRVFKDRVSRDREMPTGGKADRNYVWFSDWLLDNLNSSSLIPIDFESYRRLRYPIAKTLMPILQVGLFAARSESIFKKRYDLLCELLGISKERGTYDIKEQLGPSLTELQQQGLLARWGIEKARSVEGFNVWFTPGEQFKLLRPHQGRKSEIKAMLSSAEGATLKLLTERGVFEAQARTLIIERDERGQTLQDIEGLIEFVDSLISAEPSKYTNPPGLYYRLIKDNVPIPPTFETSRERKAREEIEHNAAEHRSSEAAQFIAYQDYRDAAIRTHIESLEPRFYEEMLRQARAEFNVKYAHAAKVFTEENIKAVVTSMVEKKVAESLPLLNFEEFAAGNKKESLA